MAEAEQLPIDGASPAPDGAAKTDGADSSAASPAVEKQPDSTTGRDGTAAKPADGEGVKAPASALEAMLEAQRLMSGDEKAGKAGESPDSRSAGKPENENDTGAAKPAEDGADKGAKPPEKNAETRVQELLAERKDLQPQAQSWGQLQAWVKANGLTQAEFEGALNLAAALRSNPLKAHKMLQPVWARLQSVTGEVLPEDLRAKVESGTLDEASARELALSRSRAVIAEHGRAKVEKDTREQEEATAFAANVKAIASTVSGWENQWKGSDPDYARKQPLVTARIKAIMLDEGYPQDAAGALEQAKRARAEVEKELGAMIPKPQPKTVLTGGISGTAVAKPKTSLEAMKAELARAAA